jgi:galactose oxidase
VQIFLLGGSWSGGRGGKNGELLVGGTWTNLTGVLATSILTADPKGVYRADNHGWFFSWSNGEGVGPCSSGVRLPVSFCCLHAMQA